MRLPVLAAAALLLPTAAVAHEGVCAPVCSEVLCSNQPRGALAATLAAEASGPTIDATITQVFGVMGSLYETGDTIAVSVEEGFEPGENVLLIVSSETQGEILGAARVEDGKVECGTLPTPEELLPLALGANCAAGLAGDPMNEPVCEESHAVGGSEGDDDSGCAAGGVGGFGFAGLLVAGAALLRRRSA